MSREQLTNQQDLWDELSLKNDVILWSLYHQQRTNIYDLQKLLAWPSAKHIFLIDSEVRCINEVQLLDSRIHLWDSTVSSHPRVHTYLFWFDWVKEVNQYLNLVSKIISFRDKTPKYFFDALLGSKRPHRSFIRNKIEQLPSKDKILLGGENCSMYWDKSPDTWISGGGHDIGSWRPIFRGMQTANISCFLPYEIFNNTWYSIVAETHHIEDIFYTEKTAKPLLAKRLFVMFSSPGHLEKLRSLGYQTFGTIIDESYDSIQEPEARWEAAWQQVLKLMDMDPLTVYAEIEPIIEHNYNLFISTNWQNKMKQEIKDILTTT